MVIEKFNAEMKNSFDVPCSESEFFYAQIEKVFDDLFLFELPSTVKYKNLSEVNGEEIRTILRFYSDQLNQILLTLKDRLMTKKDYNVKELRFDPMVLDTELVTQFTYAIQFLEDRWIKIPSISDGYRLHSKIIAPLIGVLYASLIIGQKKPRYSSYRDQMKQYMKDRYFEQIKMNLEKSKKLEMTFPFISIGDYSVGIRTVHDTLRVSISMDSNEIYLLNDVDLLALHEQYALDMLKSTIPLDTNDNIRLQYAVDYVNWDDYAMNREDYEAEISQYKVSDIRSLIVELDRLHLIWFETGKNNHDALEILTAFRNILLKHNFNIDEKLLWKADEFGFELRFSDKKDYPYTFTARLLNLCEIELVTLPSWYKTENEFIFNEEILADKIVSHFNQIYLFEDLVPMFRKFLLGTLTLRCDYSGLNKKTIYDAGNNYCSPNFYMHQFQLQGKKP